MPTYQYACTECGHEFEEFQSFSDAALTTCPVCGGRLRKVYGSVGVVFKGSGFYRTDSRNGDGKVAKSDGPAKTDTAAKSGADKKSDSGSAPGSSGSGSAGSTGSPTSGSSSTGSSSGSSGSGGTTSSSGSSSS